MPKQGRIKPLSPQLPASNCPSPSNLAAATSPSTGYNVVYQQLVKDEDDIIGQLAYCLYKQSKQQYLQEFEKRNNRRPTDEELRNHVDCAEVPALDMYKEKATSVFSELLAQAAQEKQDELEKHFKQRLWQFINRHQHEGFGERTWHLIKSLMFGGFGGVVGNFLTTVVVLLFLFWAASSASRDEFSKSAKESLISGLAEIVGVGISINSANKQSSQAAPLLPAEADKN
ncbi:hypothetical protein LER27_28695 [Pseudomonas aeruginosa]|uniref:hypothetical protein n=1 Tax=Pseudomonas aeruginosa TaxID=287 RepID=UPI000A4C0461|nr:hypothetical protein [Pseudomonas aeruginosa]MDU0540222.1 hypothetical protein [Pseudomonas aeruginosa]MDY1245781.1 hypothetical protein [Pseudomonas aeruginosa]WAE23478.1 hypothetical protein OUY23_03330 [Pseudomonas aeruginosa]